MNDRNADKAASRWRKYKTAGEAVPKHWTKSTVVSYCPTCDKTFRTITLGKIHQKGTRHSLFRKKFYVGQRARDISGERNGNHKLTVIEVRLLKNLYRAGVSTYVLGLFFLITQQNAHVIATGKSWK